MYAGIHLSLKGTVYANNSVIQITEIGETLFSSNTGLQCITDKIPCCRSPFTAGEWYFPSGEVVPIQHYVTTFYRNRGGATTGTVNLNHLNTGIISPIGLFCCEIPDADNVTQRLCANIGEPMYDQNILAAIASYVGHQLYHYSIQVPYNI